MSIAPNPYQLLVGLESGEHAVVVDADRPSEYITQASRLGDVYYLVGPLFAECCTLELAAYLQAAVQRQWEPAAAVELLNTKLAKVGVPPEAHIFCCLSLADALQTLAGLFASYS